MQTCIPFLQNFLPVLSDLCVPKVRQMALGLYYLCYGFPSPRGLFLGTCAVTLLVQSTVTSNIDSINGKSNQLKYSISLQCEERWKIISQIYEGDTNALGVGSLLHVPFLILFSQGLCA